MDNVIYPTGVWSQVVAIPDEQWGALEREIKVSFSTDARASIEAAMTEFLPQTFLYRRAVRSKKAEPLLKALIRHSDNLLLEMSELFDIPVEESSEFPAIPQDDQGSLKGLLQAFKSMEAISGKHRRRNEDVCNAVSAEIDRNFEARGENFSTYKLAYDVLEFNKSCRSIFDQLENSKVGSSKYMNFDIFLCSVFDVFILSGGDGLQTAHSSAFLAWARNIVADMIDEMGDSDYAKRLRHSDGWGLVDRVKKSRGKTRSV